MYSQTTFWFHLGGSLCQGRVCPPAPSQWALAPWVLRLPWVELTCGRHTTHSLLQYSRTEMKYWSHFKDLYGHRVADTVKKDLIGTFGL